MNYAYLVLTLSTMHFLSAKHNDEHFELILKPQWQLFEPHSQHIVTQDELVLVGSITFKKKAKENVHLTHLHFQWNGPKIEQMFGSLYFKKPTHDFVPLQENLICDGNWNKKQQTLKLTFDEKKSLGSVNEFYLVLTLPKHTTSQLKTGNFQVVATCLPEPFRPTNAEQLLLSLDALDSTISTTSE